MSEAPIDEILKQLCSRDSHAGWTLFLDENAPLILQVIRHFETDSDTASDCFQFVCERLCERRFRRLRKFKPEGAAKFSTWLSAVVRNLCLDWRRKQFGRHRAFRSIDRLSDLERQIFRLVHERGATEHDAFLTLATKFPGLTSEMVSEAIARVNQTLTTNQSWILRARTSRSLSGDETQPEPAQLPDTTPSPETLAIIKERNAMLQRSLRRLPAKDRLLIRLRFEEDLTLEQIAKLLGLGNAQRADRQIKQILSNLRLELSGPARSGKTSPSSVQVG
jgi:RNA polymerase sigma factor (sigma-70 family)